MFIHGSGENSNLWKEQFEDLNLKYNLISIDLPSHGNSESVSDLSLELYVNVINGLIETLQIKKVILCGHSLGGAIAQSYYFNYPQNVKALILVGTGGRLRVSPVILNALKSDFQEYLESIPLAAFYIKTNKSIINAIIEDTSRIPQEVVYTDFSICDRFDTLDKTNTINIPCLIIIGKQDKLTPLKYSTFFNEKIKNSKLVVIDKAAHMVMLEKPDEFNKAIQEFIENHLENK
ncbi:MAG: alpha/beta fold hydrolase [Promethearchaeota archaeon]